MTDLSRLIDLLAPHFPNESARRMLFVMAFGTTHPLIVRIDFSGAADEFTMHAVETLQRYGEVEPGKQALWKLLITLKSFVGADVAAQIDALEAFANTPQPFPATETDDEAPLVFISYSRMNREFAELLRQDLGAQGFRLWRDVHDIPAGEDWWGAIRAAIEACSSMILCLSLPALQSTVVSDEWNYARSLGKRVIPVIADDVFDHPDVLSGAVIVPQWMRTAGWVDLRPSTSERAAEFTRLVKTLRTPYTPKPVHITVKASQLPHNFVPRPREVEPLVAKLAVESPPDAVALTAALRGAGGYGKTTLAKALCRDWRVSGAFPDGIHWVTLGEKLLAMSSEVRENELVARLLDLVKEISGERPNVLKLDAAQEELTKAVAGKRLLIVIDDAWAESHLKPFLVPGKHHAVVITTRFDECIPKGEGVFRQPIDQMEPSDAVRLLAFGIDAWEVQRGWFETTSDRLGRSAQLLGIINSAITDRLRPDDHKRVKTLAAALRDVDERLDAYGVTAFQPDDPDEREQAFGRTLEVGIERLKPDERARYRLLGIFPDDVPIPLTTLAALWKMKLLLARDFCEKLAKSSLVQDYDERMLALHDVTLKYLRDTLSDSPAAHRRLIDAWGDPHALPDEYAWRYIAYHLIEAGQSDTLRALLLDYPFLQAKLNATDVNALIADCDRLPNDEVIRLIKSALNLSAHILAKDKTALAHQLYGRLYSHREQADIAALRATITLALIPLKEPTHINVGGFLLRTLSGHKGNVEGALELHDGRLLSWSKDNTLRLWNEDGSVLIALQGHTRRVWDMLELHDGRLLSWSEDNTLRLWTANGDPLNVLHGHMWWIRGALELRDGRLLSWSDDNTLRLWTADGATLIVLHGHTGTVRGALELRDGRLLSWSDDTTLRLWTANGDPISVLQGHADNVMGALELRDGRLLSWSDDKTLRLWSADGHVLAILQGNTTKVEGGLELRNGRLLSWSYDTTLRLWSADGAALSVLEGHTEHVSGAVELRDGRLLSWSTDTTLRLWTANGDPLNVLHGHTKRVEGGLELRDGRLLSWSFDDTLRLWGADGIPLAVLKGHTVLVHGARELRDGRLLSWSMDETLRLWSADAKTPLLLDGHTAAVSNMLKLRDGRLLSWSGNYDSTDTTIQLWEAEGNVHRLLEGHTKIVNGATELRDGRLLSWSDDKTLRLWAADGMALAVLKGHTEAVWGALELRDGRLLTWSGVFDPKDVTLCLWEANGTALALLKRHTGGVKGALELGNGHLLSWSQDGSLWLWEANGNAFAELDGHTEAVRGALELRDGRLLSWSYDKTLRLWAADGMALAVLKGHTYGVRGTVVLEDGRLLSWAEYENTLRLWAADGTALGVLKGHTGHIAGAVELADGRLLSWSEDTTLRLWGADGTPIDAMASDAEPAVLRQWYARWDADWDSFAQQWNEYAVSHDNEYIGWRAGNALHLCRFQTGERFASFYIDSDIRTAVFLQHGQVIALGCGNGQVIFLKVNRQADTPN